MKCILGCLLFTWTYCAATETSNTTLYRLAVHAFSSVRVWSNVLSICTLSAAGRVSRRCYIYIKAGFSPPGSLIYRCIFFPPWAWMVPFDATVYSAWRGKRKLSFTEWRVLSGTHFCWGKLNCFWSISEIQVFCRPIALPLCVPLAAIVGQNDSCLWYS